MATRKTTFMLCLFDKMIQTSEKISLLAQKYSCITKLQTAKAESFWKSNLDLNQIFKIVFTQTHLVWNSNTTELKIWKIEEYQKSWSLKGTRPNYDQKFICSDNYRQNIWNKTERCRKIRQIRKSLTSTLLPWLLLPELSFSGNWARLSM